MAKYRFRLLHGQHIEADKSKPRLDVEGKPTGRFESKTFERGSVINSDTDLAAKLGSNKFELLTGGGGEDRIAELERELADLKAGKAATVGSVSIDSPSVAPGGQVSSGFQKAVGPGGSAAMTPEEAAAHGGNVGAGVNKGSSNATSKASRDLESEHGGDFHKLTVKELHDIAASEEIELHGAHTKEDVVKALRKGSKGK